MQVEEIKVVKFTCKCSIFASHGCRVLDTPANMLVSNWGAMKQSYVDKNQTPKPSASLAFVPNARHLPNLKGSLLCGEKG